MPPDVELEKKLQKALVECEKLRSENADLKAKLNLEVNPQIANGNSPPVFDIVHNHSSSETKTKSADY